MSKPPRLPLPTWLILDAPALKTAQGTVYRCVGMLALAYWEAGCVLPVHDDITMAALVRIQPHVLRGYKPEIIRALSEITPDLDRERSRLLKSRGNRRTAMYHARTFLDRDRAMRKMEQAQQAYDGSLMPPTRRHEETKRQPAARHEVVADQGRAEKARTTPSTAPQSPATGLFSDRPRVPRSDIDKDSK